MKIHPLGASPHTFVPRSTNATPYASDPPLPNLDHVRFRPYWYARSYVRRSRRPALDLDDHHREGHRQAADGNARSALEQHVGRELLPVIRQAWLLDEPRPRKVRRVHAGSYIMRLPRVPTPGLPLCGTVTGGRRKSGTFDANSCWPLNKHGRSVIRDHGKSSTSKPVVTSCDYPACRHRDSHSGAECR